MPAPVLADARAMRALSIRQPYTELILRGLKTVEYRTWPTRLIGETFYIYAARKPGDDVRGVPPRAAQEPRFGAICGPSYRLR